MEKTKFVQTVRRFMRQALEDYLLYSKWSRQVVKKDEEMAEYFSQVSLLRYEDAKNYAGKISYYTCVSEKKIFDEVYKEAVEEFNQ